MLAGLRQVHASSLFSSPIEVDMRRDLPVRVLLCVAVVTALASGSAPAVATDPNGIAVCTEANDQVGPVTVSDGTGGIVVAWHDNRPTAAAGGVCGRPTSTPRR